MKFREFFNYDIEPDPLPKIEQASRTAEELVLDGEFWKNIDDSGVEGFHEKVGEVFKQIFEERKGKKWFSKTSSERQKLVAEWQEYARKKVFEEHRDYYIKSYIEWKKQNEEALSLKYKKVVAESEATPDLKEAYQAVIQSVFSPGSGVQFEVKGAGNVLGRKDGHTGGFCSYKFNPETKALVNPDSVDEIHQSILPYSITELLHHKDQKLFEEETGSVKFTAGEEKEPIEKYLFYSRIPIVGKEGDLYYSDDRPGHAYTIGIGVDLKKNPDAIKQKEILARLEEKDLKKILNMVADTFIPEYNKGIANLAEKFNSR